MRIAQGITRLMIIATALVLDVAAERLIELAD